MDGDFVLEEAASAEILPIGIFNPTLEEDFVGEVKGVLEVLKTGHEAHRHGRGALVFVERRTEFAFKTLPVDFASEFNQGMRRIDKGIEPNVEEGLLLAVLGRLFRLHLQGFRG